MPCETCYSLQEQIRELEAKVRYLESQTYSPAINNPPHPDLEVHVDWLNNRYFTKANVHE